MREKYRERLEEKLFEEKQKVFNTFIENSVVNKQTEGFQPIRMVFLTEQNAADSEWRASALENADSDKIITQSDRPLSYKDDALQELKAKSMFKDVIQVCCLNYIIFYIRLRSSSLSTANNKCVNGI
jgi:hypothetical protein